MAPKITSFNVNKTSGILPLAIKATVNAKDPEKDNLTYIWDFGNGSAKKETRLPNWIILSPLPAITKFLLRLKMQRAHHRKAR